MLAKIRSALASFGFLNGSLYICGEAMRRASGGRCAVIKYYFVAQPIRPAPQEPPRHNEAASVEIISADHPMVAEFPRPGAIIRHRFETGTTCFLATMRQAFAGFLWIGWNRYREDEVRCLYVLAEPARTVWDFDVYVEPAYRLGRTFGRLWSNAARVLSERGVQWSFSRISAFKPESLAAHARLGAVKCHSAVFLRLGTLQLSVFTLRPFLHVSFSQRQVPTIVLRAPDAR